MNDTLSKLFDRLVASLHSDLDSPDSLTVAKARDQVINLLKNCSFGTAQVPASPLTGLSNRTHPFPINAKTQKVGS